MSARSIIAEAFKARLVPASLYGKTQHKTLQARISEDIIARNTRSQFFRTAPGKFFLAEFIDDASIPEEFRDRFPARPRVRGLARGPALALDSNVVRDLFIGTCTVAPAEVYDLLQSNRYSYEDPKKSEVTRVFFRAFVCVRRKKEVLTYRMGRYRDDRDAFMSRRSIGFSTLINMEERTLFNIDTFGIIEAGIRAVKMDLNIPFDKQENAHMKEATLSHFVLTKHSSNIHDILAVIHFRCPSWFEPTKRRLALNNLAWMSINQKVNNLEDFDPWSQKVLSILHK